MKAALPLLSFTLACAGQEPPAVANPREELARLLARHDAAPAGERAGLARRIDELAGQRYAVWSRLYWHRDLGEATAEARATGRPILSLRMLGRLDRDLSCANSRFFRVALYANRAVASTLARDYILHWSSERPVPVARIDFGDGRVLERTVAGNSAHYVLDREGRPVDVLPGLYTPALFMETLARARPVAVRAGALDDGAQRELVARFHAEEARRAAARFATLGRAVGRPGGGSLMDAERRAMSKARVEIPVVESLQLGTQLTLEQAREFERSSGLWDQIGASLSQGVPGRLDRRSRALFAALQPADWARAGQPLPRAGVAKLVAAFEAVMTRDAAYNELVLHQVVHAHMAAQGGSFAELNRWVYAALFLTAAEDPWLGMATPDVFTALPRDGIAASL